MASSSKDASQQGVPPANGDHHTSDTTSSFYKSERKSSIPIPPSDPIIPPLLNPGNPPPPISPKPPLSDPPQGPPPSQPQPHPQPGDLSARHRFLSPTEWARVAHGIGAIREGEEHQVVHPTCWYWPSRGLPDGLYRDVVIQRTKYSLSFQLLNMLHWILMVLQVMVGAILTALGSLPMREATPITALAAVNTVGAGLIGLMHNSGLPDRYRMDKAQFLLVEDYLKVSLPRVDHRSCRNRQLTANTGSPGHGHRRSSSDRGGRPRRVLLALPHRPGDGPVQQARGVHELAHHGQEQCHDVPGPVCPRSPAAPVAGKRQGASPRWMKELGDEMVL